MKLCACTCTNKNAPQRSPAISNNGEPGLIDPTTTFVDPTA